MLINIIRISIKFKNININEPDNNEFNLSIFNLH